MLYLDEIRTLVPKEGAKKRLLEAFRNGLVVTCSDHLLPDCLEEALSRWSLPRETYSG